MELRALSLDDLVPAEHRVRLMRAFAEGLDRPQHDSAPDGASDRAFDVKLDAGYAQAGQEALDQLW